MNFIDWLLVRAKKNPGPHMRGFMKRYFLFRSDKFSIVLHDIRRADPGGERGSYHNHPYWYISIVLRGSYKEEMPGKPDLIRKAGDICVRSPKDRHRISPIGGPVLSLFIRFGSPMGEWGLYDAQGNYTSMKQNTIVNVKGPNNYA